MPPPKFLTCYLCGQQFGSASLGIHQKQCYTKKMKQWSAQHPSDRGPKPIDPAEMKRRQEVQMQEQAVPVMSVRQSANLFCKNCGEPHDQTAKFCQECGTRITVQSTPAPSQMSVRSSRSSVQPKAQHSGFAMEDVEAMNQNALDMFRTPCSICGRKFDPERVRRHEDACRAANKKRRTFDAHKHRVQGTDMEGNQRTYVREVKKGIPTQKKESKWRQQHREFVQGIRAAKRMQDHIAGGGNVRDLPPPPPSHNPDYVQCPHCSRRFAPQAAERHIHRCRYTVNRPKPPSSFGTATHNTPKMSRSAISSTTTRQPRMSGVRESRRSGPDFVVLGGGGGGGGGGGVRNTSSGPFGASYSAAGIDPRSNVQTTSVIGSGLISHTHGRRKSQPEAPGRASDLPSVPARGASPSVTRRQTEEKVVNYHGRRIGSSNQTSSAMYGVFGGY